jgi:hypothetical protein
VVKVVRAKAAKSEEPKDKVSYNSSRVSSADCQPSSQLERKARESTASSAVSRRSASPVKKVKLTPEEVCVSATPFFARADAVQQEIARMEKEAKKAKKEAEKLEREAKKAERDAIKAEKEAQKAKRDEQKALEQK